MSSVVVLGGRLRSVNQTISGPDAEHMLHSVVADYAFIGTDAVHPQYGIASRTLEQSRLKTLMMQRTRQIVVVADRRKLSTDQFNYWSPLPARWRLITDDDADPAALDELRATGAQIDLTHPLRALTDTANLKGNSAVTNTSTSTAATPSGPSHRRDSAPSRAAPAQRPADRAGARPRSATRRRAAAGGRGAGVRHRRSHLSGPQAEKRHLPHRAGPRVRRHRGRRQRPAARRRGHGRPGRGVPAW